MERLNWKMGIYSCPFYISDTLFSYFDMVQLLWHNLYCVCGVCVCVCVVCVCVCQYKFKFLVTLN